MSNGKRFVLPALTVICCTPGSSTKIGKGPVGKLKPLHNYMVTYLQLNTDKLGNVLVECDCNLQSRRLKSGFFLVRFSTVPKEKIFFGNGKAKLLEKCSLFRLFFALREKQETVRKAYVTRVTSRTRFSNNTTLLLLPPVHTGSTFHDPVQRAGMSAFTAQSSWFRRTALRPNRPL